jgi:hypothetical protein
MRAKTNPRCKGCCALLLPNSSGFPNYLLVGQEPAVGLVEQYFRGAHVHGRVHVDVLECARISVISSEVTGLLKR